jgi:NAD(P)-dependent dehydrogenase (short-subunit alcohol dehydrogenase family)
MGLRLDRVIDTNLNGFFRVTQPLADAHGAHRWGRIINIEFGGGADGQSRPGQLLRRQGGPARRDQVIGA